MSQRATLPTRLRHRLSLQSPVLTADGLGGQTVTWGASTIIWGEVQAPGTLRALEAGDATQSLPRAEVRIFVRRRASLSKGQRVQWGTRLFAIRAILDEGRSPYVELVTEEVL
ncbi:MAG: phage head closure protein [Rickettsiales bacterium]|nr:phage head closure protein [Rickettsiales bacterium]